MQNLVESLVIKSRKTHVLIGKALISSTVVLIAELTDDSYEELGKNFVQIYNENTYRASSQKLIEDFYINVNKNPTADHNRDLNQAFGQIQQGLSKPLSCFDVKSQVVHVTETVIKSLEQKNIYVLENASKKDMLDLAGKLIKTHIYDKFLAQQQPGKTHINPRIRRPAQGYILAKTCEILGNKDLYSGYDQHYKKATDRTNKDYLKEALHLTDDLLKIISFIQNKDTEFFASTQTVSHMKKSMKGGFLNSTKDKTIPQEASKSLTKEAEVYKELNKEEYKKALADAKTELEAVRTEIETLGLGKK